jgi:hypothetical protein
MTVFGLTVCGVSVGVGVICFFFAQHLSQYFFPFANVMHSSHIGLLHHPQLYVHSI